MAKEALIQVRMDSDLKEKVEQLYKSLGTSFAEAVRIFARQSITQQGMPFVVTTEKRSAAGMLAQYANPALREEEEAAFLKAMVSKHGHID